MYNNSYKGFKRKKYKDSYRGLGTVGRTKKIKKEKGTFHLQIIRITAVLLALGLAVGGIITGFAVFGRGNQSYKNNRSLVHEDNTTELLRVVNRSHPLERDFVPQLKDFEGCSVNNLAFDSLDKMLKDAKEQSVDLVLKKAYVSYDDQNKEYNKALLYIKSKKNLTEVKAQARVQGTTPQAGKSEYQTGLLFYLSTGEKYKSFKDTKAYHWLEKNSVNYGFVIRYTDAKKGYTSMTPSSHIFRYVGQENALLMRSCDMCLEEYSSYINSR